MVHDSSNLSDRVIKLIDTNIVISMIMSNYHNLEDFDWHHNENIIFYIKENLNNVTGNNQLKSYNFRIRNIALS